MQCLQHTATVPARIITVCASVLVLVMVYKCFVHECPIGKSKIKEKDGPLKVDEKLEDGAVGDEKTEKILRYFSSLRKYLERWMKRVWVRFLQSSSYQPTFRDTIFIAPQRLQSSYPSNNSPFFDSKDLFNV